MVYYEGDLSGTIKKQNNILDLIGPGGPVVFPPSLLVGHNDRAFYI